MSTTINADALAKLSKKDLLALLGQVLEAQVTQVATPEPEAKADTRPVCGRTKSSDGQPCTRKATQDDGACKSHTGDWDNAEAAAKAEQAAEFVESRRKAAEERAKSGKLPKSSNRELAAALRSLGITPNGEPWATAKALVAEGKSPEDAALSIATK